MASSQSAVLVSNNVVTTENKLDPTTKRKLIIIGVIAAVIVIIVIIVAVIIDYKDIDTSNWCEWCNGGGSGSGVDIYSEGEVNYVCGNRFDCNRSPFVIYTTDISECFEDLNKTNCAYLCSTQTYDDWNMKNAFYIPNTDQCYCYTWNQYDAIESTWRTEDWDHYCFNTTETVEKYSIDQYYIAYGRPYYIYVNDINTQTLNADIKQIDCDEYNYFENEQWMQFVHQNHSNMKLDDNNNILHEWIQRGLSEHASIATFSRFTLELMSIGAPLWLIELSNKASLDEIRHTQIAFDVVNIMYKQNGECVVPNMFPQHEINIDGNWNRISKDTVFGGCFGETISALTITEKYKYNNIIDQYLYDIAMDEIRHAALAWVTIKWMIHNNIQNNIDIANREWWNKQIKQLSMKQNSKDQNQNEKYFYISVIASIVDKLWIDMEYKTFYNMVVKQLQYELQQENDNSQCWM